MVEHYDKVTSKYISIYKDSLKNRPYEIVQLCEKEDQEECFTQVTNENVNKSVKTNAPNIDPYSEQTINTVDEVFNYVFAGNLLTGLAQKYKAIRTHEVLDKDLTKDFLALPEINKAVNILKDTTRLSKVNITQIKGNIELKQKVSQIQHIIWEIAKASRDVLLIQFFQTNVIELNLHTPYLLTQVLSRKEIENFFDNWKPYTGTIIAL